MGESKERAAAEVNFVSAQKPARNPQRAKTEQEEERRAVDDKTARLKAERNKRDAADTAAKDRND